MYTCTYPINMDEFEKKWYEKNTRSLEKHWIVWMAIQSYSWVCKKVCKQYRKKSYEDFWNKCRMIYIYIKKQTNRKNKLPAMKRWWKTINPTKLQYLKKIKPFLGNITDGLGASGKLKILLTLNVNFMSWKEAIK